MKRFLFALLCAGALQFTAHAQSGPPHESGARRKADLVELIRVDRNLHLDIRYATRNNFLHTPLYKQARAFLQRPAAEALAQADRDLQRSGYGLAIYDAYRPWRVTQYMWDHALPAWRSGGYVADPATGSRHNRGCAVDLTLYDRVSGQEVEMPTAYDDFTQAAHSDYAGCSDEAKRHRDLLRQAMMRHGFAPLAEEWWHFDFRLWRQYPILDVDFDQISTTLDADLVLRNAAVYTVDAARSWAEAVAVRDGVITYVGTNAGVHPYVGERTQVLNLSGRMVLPSFCDSHVHPVSSGVEMGQCNLADLDTPPKVFAAIRAYARKYPQRPWIFGSGWALPVFPRASPTKEQLDAIVSDRPAFLEAADGHSAWVNSKALQMAQVTRATPDPPHGRIERNARGEPSGTLREAAMHLVYQQIPAPTPQDYLDGLQRALHLANSFGITCVQEAAANDALLTAYATADQHGELTARVHASVVVRPAGGTAQIQDLIEKRRTYESQHLHLDGAKMFADGVIEAHTAALLEPYLPSGKDRGMLNFDPPLFNALVVALDAAGFQVHVHAIGDRAIRAALDAFSVALQTNGWHDLRHHIAHLQLVHPADIPRFEPLHVVANFQAYWAQADLYVTRLTNPFLGAVRAGWQYPLASVAATGAVMVGGSDWNVSSMNPLDAIQVAMLRRPINDRKAPPWLPQQRVSLPLLLAMYTINGAYLAHEEEVTGSIETGKSADLVVLDRNLFRIPAEQIHQVKVLLTLLEGKTVYRAPAYHQ